MNQIPFDIQEFADNPEPRCPCVLLLDCSSSMQGEPLEELAAGVDTYHTDVMADDLAAKRVEVALITFGEKVEVKQPFSTIESFEVPEFEADGPTPMGQAIVEGMRLLQVRKAQYQQAGIPYFRPWMFLVTDGEPTDYGTGHWQEALKLVQDAEASQALSFFPVAVQGANTELLSRVSQRRRPLHLKGLNFQEMFLWLSNSQKMVSRSRPGDRVDLDDPTGPSGWGSV